MSSPTSSSYLLRITPEHNFDIHVLRTFTRELNGWIVRLQSTSPNASDTINHVIYALNNTFRDVELSYRVWRNERVQSVLQHGFHYARARIQAALWRQERGRPVATFPAIYPAFQFSGVINPSSERQPMSLPPNQGNVPYYPPNTNTKAYAPPGPSSSAPWSPQPQSAQPYPVQNNTFPPRNEPSTQPPQVGSPTGYSQGFGQPSPHVDYPPPPYPPPPQWRPPDPAPGSPPVPASAAPTVDIAIRYLEAVNKAINICIEFDAM